MARYDNEDYGTPNRMNQQRDLVLSINEFCFLQNKTDGTIKTHVGPLTTTISGQESLVTFNARSKKFEETSNFDVAKQLFVSAPEGWYIVLKNPTTDNHYPEVGKPNISPKTIKIGTKINIPGPISFALYPGQMAKAVRGHKLRSNQYLLARVYDADAANKNIAEATIVNAEGKEVIKNPGLASEPIYLGQNEYFVLGDNRNNSTDSREPSVGNIHKKDILGRAWLRIWPLYEFELLTDN